MLNFFLSDSMKNSRNSNKKTEETAAVIEPPKKKGRAAKKEKLAEKDIVEVNADDEVKVDVKEKKPAKRGRAAAAKPASVIEETAAATNGDAEEVLPKSN